MPEYITPFTRQVDLQNGTIPTAPLVHKRYLSDLKGLFHDAAAEAAMMVANPLLYEVHEASPDIPMDDGQLRYSTTVIFPGKVGNEYFFTKGHYHANGSRAEIYYGLVGEGLLIMQTREGEVNIQRMTPGVAALVPPYWGHRTINIGTGNFAFLAVYPADAGYDYGAIAEKGFASLVVERAGKMEVIPNPLWQR
ncbi:MAG TPA: glucose-6-phosphate isomerase family protein [Aggregatilineales bacterium]|nr:glucose-6-phosphate isomerase family protein [Aggregatilineales bacterium]